MIYDENNKKNLCTDKPQSYQIYRKEPNSNYLRRNENQKITKEEENENDDDDDSSLDYDDNNNFSNSAAFDSLKNYRKNVSRGNSRSNIRINNRSYSYYNDDESNNVITNQKSNSNNSLSEGINNENDNVKINNGCDIHENDDQCDDNEKNSSDPKIKMIPRNEVKPNDNEEFNELFINKSYIMKKFDKMMDDLGLTTEGRMTLMNLSLEKKWEIFKMQKDKMNNECNNPNADPSSYDNSPKYFINILKKKILMPNY